MKILAIGNSFSEDATAYLHDIAKSSGENIFVVNLYIGGCSLKTHWENILNNSPNYTMMVNGINKEVKVSIKETLLLKDWDIVTL